MIRTVFNLTNDITDQVLWDRIHALTEERDRLKRLWAESLREINALRGNVVARAVAKRPATVAAEHARYFAPKFQALP